MSRLRRVWAEKFPWIWASLTMVLVIAVAGLAVALFRVEGCINDNLGKRSAPSSQDAAAHIDFAQAVYALFDQPPDATLRERQQIGLTFKAQVHTYVVTLLADQREREENPLGQC